MIIMVSVQCPEGLGVTDIFMPVHRNTAWIACISTPTCTMTCCVVETAQPKVSSQPSLMWCALPSPLVQSALLQPCPAALLPPVWITFVQQSCFIIHMCFLAARGPSKDSACVLRSFAPAWHARPALAIRCMQPGPGRRRLPWADCRWDGR